MTKRIHLNIGGMSCVQCQTKIEKALNATAGVKKARVSYTKGTADIEYDDEKTSVKRIKKVIEKLDYTVLDSGINQMPDARTRFALLAVIFLLFYLLQSLGVLNYLAPSQLAETGMGYGMLFLIGVITSVHCVAMCGGIGLSQSLKQSDRGGVYLRPILYNLGRVCSYTLIGLVLGTLGSLAGGNAGVAIPYFVQGLLKLVVGIFMVIFGINMLGIFPGLRKFAFHTPVAIAKLIGSKNMADKGPFVIGLLNGFMPCGPLQAMWLVALAAGSPVAGALSMLAFSLGTVPLMLGLGSFVSLMGKRFTAQVMRVGAVLVVVMGLAMISQGGTLSRMHPALGSESMVVAEKSSFEDVPAVEETLFAEETEPTEEITPSGEVQEVNSTLGVGYYPEITVKAGTPVKWTIDVPQGTINGCNAVMIVPDYGIQHAFDYGENVIEFTPTEPGLVCYSCWMGMVYGSINVIE